MKQLQRVYIPQFLAPSVNKVLVCLRESLSSKTSHQVLFSMHVVACKKYEGGHRVYCLLTGDQNYYWILAQEKKNNCLLTMNAIFTVDWRKSNFCINYWQEMPSPLPKVCFISIWRWGYPQIFFFFFLRIYMTFLLKILFFVGLS